MATKLNIVCPEVVDFIYGTFSLAIKEILERHGFLVIISNKVGTANCDIEVVLSPLLHGPIREKKKNVRYIMLRGEKFPTIYGNSDWERKKWERTKSLLKDYDYILEAHNMHKSLYNEVGRKFSIFKLGYHKYFDKYKEEVQDIDVSFCGSINERRKKILDKLSGYKHKFIDPPVRIHGATRDKLINSSKVNINIHFSDSKILETGRVIMLLMCSKAFVITEDFLCNDDIIDGKHLVVSNKNDIIDKIDYYLNNPNEAKDIAENGYEYLKNHRTLESSLITCLKEFKII